MARLAGKNGAVKIVATGGAVAEICDVTGWKATVNTATIDTTGMCENGVSTFIAGPTTHTVSISAKWEQTETDLVGSPPAIVSGTIVDYDLYPDDTLTNLHWDGTGIVTSFSVDCPYDGLLTWEMEIQGSGALTPPTAVT